jgi:DNA-binding MarR family transcriptional regulator
MATASVDLIHQQLRLRIMATLRAVPEGDLIEFTRLRDILGATDGNLGTHLSILEQAGFIGISKEFVRRKPRTQIALTRAGQEAFEAHVRYLRDIIDGS